MALHHGFVPLACFACMGHFGIERHAELHAFIFTLGHFLALQRNSYQVTFKQYIANSFADKGSNQAI